MFEKNPQLRSAAEILDAKFESLVAGAMAIKWSSIMRNGVKTPLASLVVVFSLSSWRFIAEVTGESLIER